MEENVSKPNNIEEISREIIRYLEGIVNEEILVSPSDRLNDVFNDSASIQSLGLSGVKLEFASFIETEYKISINKISAYKNRDLTVYDVAKMIYGELQRRNAT